jgi:hypothetical protein
MSVAPSPSPCLRCGQPTRHFWLEEIGALSPWCNFCVSAQVLSYIGSRRTLALVSAFARAIDAETPQDVKAVSVALRALAALVHDEGTKPEPPTDADPRQT